MSRRSLIVLLLCAVVASIMLVRSVSAAPETPQDMPEILVASGVVSDFTRVNTVLYWHSVGSCYTPPGGPSSPTFTSDVAEAVTRTSTIYASPTRGLYYKDLRATNQLQSVRVLAGRRR